jgi:cellulose synthase/poly-beta-1,6-N-acetylglucosamine synthase-like glycosyltransferase
MLSDVIGSVLTLNYSNYLVYIVADNCDVTALSFNDKRVIVLKPEKVLASNTRSHFFAIERFQRDHERLTIIDSDNLLHPEFLNELNKGFNKGFKAVQGLRKAKNLNSMYACLDAARDIYYHFYDGKILFNTGSSATLAGSGMAFTTALYRECLAHKDITGAGFDKILQFEIVRRNLRIAFTEQAIVYDEKTSESEMLVKQRSRWIGTWVRYSYFGFLLIVRSVKKFSLNQFLFGVTLLRPPLFILLILSMTCTVINIWIDPSIGLLWLLALTSFTAGFILSLMSSNTDRRIYLSLTQIPRFMFYQIIALFGIAKANERSIATKHFNIKDIT